jgi:hypothetical protein
MFSSIQLLLVPTDLVIPPNYVERHISKILKIAGKLNAPKELAVQEAISYTLKEDFSLK